MDFTQVCRSIRLQILQIFQFVVSNPWILFWVKTTNRLDQNLPPRDARNLNSIPWGNFRAASSGRSVFHKQQPEQASPSNHRENTSFELRIVRRHSSAVRTNNLALLPTKLCAGQKMRRSSHAQNLCKCMGVSEPLVCQRVRLHLSYKR